MNKEYKYKVATINELEARWDKNIANNFGDDRWVKWKDVAIENNKSRKCVTFVVMRDDEPIGEGTLVLSAQSVEINGLRIDKQYRNNGHASKPVKIMEQWAKAEGYTTIIIGAEAKNVRNLSIYFRWGYDTFVKSEISEIEEEGLILFYAKIL